MAWVGAACQQGRRLVPRLWQELGLRVSPRTLKRALRRAGYGWKRTRRSLKRQRDPAAFAACRQQLAGLHRAEQAGRLAVYYLDEGRFSRQAPVPYAGQVRGQPCVCRPAERGAGGGYSVLGFWRPADPQATGCQAFTAIVSATAFTAEPPDPAHRARARQCLDSLGPAGQSPNGSVGGCGLKAAVFAALFS